MPDILVKQVPTVLHTRLRAEARRHRRSMTQEILTILEKELGTTASRLPAPIEGGRPLTQRLVTEGIREGRA